MKHVGMNSDRNPFRLYSIIGTLYSFQTWETEFHHIRLITIQHTTRKWVIKSITERYLFLCCLFGNSKRYLFVNFLFCENDNHRKMTKRQLKKNIFLSSFYDSYRHLFILLKDNLKIMSFCFLDIFFVLSERQLKKENSFSILYYLDA